MSVVDKFLLSVNKWKCLCFDTKSNGKLKFNVPPNKGQEGRIPVVFGNPDGLVLILHDARMVPQKIKDICADFGYVKLQCGIENDIELLKPLGFTLEPSSTFRHLWLLAILPLKSPVSKNAPDLYGELL